MRLQMICKPDLIYTGVILAKKAMRARDSRARRENFSLI